MSETTYKLRKLRADDIFTMSAIISAVGLKELKKCFSPQQVQAFMDAAGGNEEREDAGSGGKKGMDVSALGMSVIIDMAGLILENLPKCKKELYAFLADLSGLDRNEIGSLGMAAFAQMVADVISQDEFKDFIRVASGLARSGK